MKILKKYFTNTEAFPEVLISERPRCLGFPYTFSIQGVNDTNRYVFKIPEICKFLKVKPIKNKFKVYVRVYFVTDLKVPRFSYMALFRNKASNTPINWYHSPDGLCIGSAGDLFIGDAPRDFRTFMKRIYRALSTLEFIDLEAIKESSPGGQFREFQKLCEKFIRALKKAWRNDTLGKIRRKYAEKSAVWKV